MNTYYIVIVTSVIRRDQSLVRRQESLIAGLPSGVVALVATPRGRL